MKKIKIIMLASLIAFTFSCTKNQMARQFGGEQVIEIECGKKVVNMTWKKSDLWIQTRPFRSHEKPETTMFNEKSSFGLLEGLIVIKECK